MQKNTFRSQSYNVKYRLHQQNGSKRQEKTIIRKGYQKYKKFIKERQISKIIKKGTLQESYNKWTEEVVDAIKQVQKTVRKNPRKDIRELQKIRKNPRIKIRNTTYACEKRILNDRLEENITDEIKESRDNQIKQIAESISNNIDNSRKIWEVTWKVKRKDETPHFIINSEGRKTENSEEILKEYQKYYEHLLQTRPPENLQEEKIKQDVNTKFQRIVDDEHNVERNSVEEERQIPLQWRETSIKSLYKGGRSKEEIQESQRGIFITNLVSKAYEIVNKIQNEIIQSNIGSTMDWKTGQQWITSL